MAYYNDNLRLGDKMTVDNFSAAESGTFTTPAPDADLHGLLGVPLTGAARRAGDSLKWGRYPADVLPLWVADMDYPAAPPILDAVRAHVATGDLGYRFDSPTLRAVVCEQMAARYGAAFLAEHIVFSPGLVFAMNAFARAFAQPGDGAIVMTPLYPPFFGAIANAGLTAQPAPMRAHVEAGILRYAIDWDALEAAVTPASKLLMLCSPHNPTGRTFTRDELARLAAFAIRHDLLVLADEIHGDLLAEGIEHHTFTAAAPEAADRTVTLIAPSKTFNLAGMGLGMALCANDALRLTLANAIHGIGGFPGTLAFTAAEAAYRHGGPWLRAMRAHLQANRDFTVSWIREHMPLIATTRPDATYLAWLDCRALPLADGEAPAAFFERVARVGLNDGAAFGPEGVGFVRLNYACTPETLRAALHAMAEAVRGLA